MATSRVVPVLLLVAAFLTLGSQRVLATPPDFVAGRLMVKLSSADTAEAEAVLAKHGLGHPKHLINKASDDEQVDSGGEMAKWFEVDVPPGQEKSLAKSLARDGQVLAAEPDSIANEQTEPNDTYFNSYGTWGRNYFDMWGLHIINMSAAWDLATASNTPTVIVADVDSGLDITHPDISANVWTNPGEIPANHVDDDHNGYIDDVHGWDFANNDNNPADDTSHGSHTAGTIAAVGNNAEGVIGVSPSAKVMPLKFMNSGSGALSDAAEALVYAADQGAKVSNHSWACNCSAVGPLNDALQYAHDAGMFISAAAANYSTDTLNYSPANSPTVVAVGAITATDTLAYYSNVGPKVDVVAPGSDILSLLNSTTICSTLVGTRYCRMSGTSMSSPHVAGLAALILSQHPNYTNEEVRQIIRSTAADLGAAGPDNLFGYGRIDAAAALASLRPLNLYIRTPHSIGLWGGPVEVIGTASGLDFDHYTLEVGAGRTPTSWTLLVTSATPVTNGLLGTFAPGTILPAKATVRLRGYTTGNSMYEFKTFDVTLDGTAPAVTLTAPKNAANVRVNSNITIKANASDSNGIAKVEFKVNGNTVCTDTTSSYSCVWRTTVLGTTTLSAVAVDKALPGNRATSTVTVTVIP